MKRRGESAISTLIALAILGVALYMVFPSWFEPWIPDNPFSGEITIQYEDGTSRTVKTGVLSGSIQDSTGKAISSISYSVRVTPTYTGTPTSTSATGSFLQIVDGVQKNSSPITYNSLMNSGTGYTVKTGSISASTIEGWNTVQGTHTLKLQADMSFSATYSSGSVSSKSGSFTATISYNVVSQGVTALSVTVTSTVN